MKFIGIIPARYASTRFPGKPLAMLDGKPVIQHVYEKVASCLEAAYVATDDERIFNAVEAFGGKAVMTRKDHMVHPRLHPRLGRAGRRCVSNHSHHRISCEPFLPLASPWQR